MNKTALIAGLAIAGAAAAVAAPAPAPAHNPQNIYGPEGSRWPAGTVRLFFEFDRTVPKGRWRTRIAQGATEWNRYNRRVFFEPGDPDVSRQADPTFNCPTRRPAPSIVFRAGFPSRYGTRVIGLNYLCRSDTGVPLYFRQYYNADFQFWTDPNSNGKIPRGATDLRSLAAHEMGHATGWGPHLDDDGPDAGSAKDYRSYCRSWNQQTVADDQYDPQPTDTPMTAKQTMCYAIANSQVGQRKLGAHDRGTFRAAYGPR